MTPYDPDDVDVPWGKYTYALEGLATRCYLEGPADPLPSGSRTPNGRRLSFRVELPTRCFVNSVTVKLPHAPPAMLPMLQDILIERSLCSREFEKVYDAYRSNQFEKEHNTPGKDRKHLESPTSVGEVGGKKSEDERGEQPPPRKKVMQIKRAADALRITVTDMDVEEGKSAQSSERPKGGDASEDGSDTGELQTLGIAVWGYVRGQTLPAKCIKILLNSAAKLGFENTLADRAEVDGLLGLAFLANRRYRQAAELLQRASELVAQVAEEDAKAGIAIDEAMTWAAELNLLSAHAYFEHMPMSNDGIVRLMQVAATAKKRREDEDEGKNERDAADLTVDFLDLRTELLNMLESLLAVLVKFLADSNSLAVKMASARMIEFVSEQLGCAVATHMQGILNQALRLYPKCTVLEKRERVVASSFPYDSMEECLERLIDICCRLFPLTEHSVLLELFDKTLIPAFLDGFQESGYLYFDCDVEEAADGLLATAVAQSLRVIYLVLSILGADARVPISLITRVLNILVTENGNARTPLLLRRVALHTWDSISKSLRRAAFGSTVDAFVELLKALKDYIPKLLVDFARPEFQYGEIDDEVDLEVEVVKEEYLVPENSQELADLLKKRRRRIEIIDRHTLGRLLALIHNVCNALQPSDEEEERHLDVTISLQEVLARSIADLFMSSLIDVSYHEAVASGNGSNEGNSPYEFGDINTQLKVVSDVLEELFESYWASVNLLPSSLTTDIVRTAPIRAVLGWCVNRMAHSAPPRGMLKLLIVTVRGLQHELNSPMHKLPAVPMSPHEVTFIDIHRALIRWFPQSTFEEAFDLLDVLTESVAEDLMARDLSLLVQGLGDQTEKFQKRTDVSLELLASIVASRVPRHPDLAMSSLRALVNPALRKQRISNGFPKSTRSNTGSFTRRMQTSQPVSRVDPMSKSLYIHIVLASCFDKFDALGVAGKRRGGPTYMGDKIDAFVEHAALAVRCLHACARATTHREYVGAVLGDIFWTCLAMQDHGDGRVRLAGFEIFAASLDVLFHTQNAMILVPSQPTSTVSEATALNVGPVPNVAGMVCENANGVTELVPHCEKEAITQVSASCADGPDANDLQYSAVMQRKDSSTENGEHCAESKDVDATLDKEIHTVFAEGGSYSFYMEHKSPSQLEFEERGWQMLCAFVTSSLGIGKYVDFVVQRACLEYLKGCILNALRGRSTGASVITFEHIGLLWDAVNRLVGSPWKTLNALALWVICAIMNVSLYSSIMAKGRGVTRQRTSQLNEFLISQVFPRAECFLKSEIRETRIWGMCLVETYLRARDLNTHVAQVVPGLSGKVLRHLDRLKHDWEDDIRERSQSLLEIHFNSHHKKSSLNSFTQQATSFMTMKRYQNDDDDGANSSAIELWFPPLPKQMKTTEMEVYCRTLEAFANAEIEGGEETELVGAAEEEDENEEAYDGEYDEDDGGYGFGEGEIGGKAEDSFNDETQLAGNESIVDGTEVGNDDEAAGLLEDDSAVNEEDVLKQRLDSVPLTEAFDTDGTRKTTSNDEVDLTPSVQTIEQTDDDDVEDKEFAEFSDEPTRDEAQQLPLFTQVSDAEDEGSAPNVVPVRFGSSDDEDEEVVDVTDEEDVLMDLESVKRDSKDSASQLSSTVIQGEDSKLQAAFSNRPLSRRQGSLPLVGLDLNPDLDEGKQVLRRKGSFTSRPSTSPHIEEGDAPKLARRRSHDVSAFLAAVETPKESKPASADDGDSSVGSGGGRLLRRRSSKSLFSSPKSPERSLPASPRAGDAPLAKLENIDEQRVKEGNGDGQVGDLVNSGLLRLSKRKSLKSESSKDDESSQRRVSEEVQNMERESKEDIVRGTSPSLSPRRSRVSRGIRMDEDDSEFFEARPKQSHGAAMRGESGRSQFENESRSSGSKANRRSLPRAPAFLKGGGLARRKSGNLGSNASGVVSEGSRKIEGISSVNNGLSSGTASGSLSAPSLPGAGGNRLKVARGRGQANKSPRPEAVKVDMEGLNERRPDRSHRFSKREPLMLGFGKNSEEIDRDLFGDLDGGFDVDDELESQIHTGTPTAEAVHERKALADDSPISGYSRRRGSNRTIFSSQRYRSLLDQIENGPNESSRSGSPHGGGLKSFGSNGTRDGEKTFPISSARREALEKLDVAKPDPSASKAETRERTPSS